MSDASDDFRSTELAPPLPPAGVAVVSVLPRDRLAASYARVNCCEASARDHDASLTIAEQHALNASTASRFGFTIPDDPRFRYSDRASGASVERPGLDRLRGDAQAGAPWSMLVCTDPPRLTRAADPRARYALESWFQCACGVAVRYSDHAGTADPPGGDTRAFGGTTPAGLSSVHTVGPNDAGQPLRDFGAMLARHLDAVGIRQEQHAIVARTRRGIRQLFARGLYAGGPRVPYGTVRLLQDTRTGQVRVLRSSVPAVRARRQGDVLRLVWADDGSLDVVVRIFEWTATGVGLRDVARRLNAAGVPSPATRFLPRGARPAALWKAWHLTSILSNPLYVGRFVWGRRAPVRRGCPFDEGSGDAGPGPIASLIAGVPPVSESLWEAVQRVLAARRQRARPTRRGPR